MIITITFAKESCNPGDNIIQATAVPSRSIMAYIILVEVEFLHDGQAAQQSWQAAEPQQQANWKRNF